MIDVIVLDLWETLATKKRRIFDTLEQHYKLPTDAFPFFKDQLLKLETSAISEGDFWHNLHKEFNIPNSINTLGLLDIYRDITVINEQLLQFVTNFRSSGGKAALFSNTDKAAKVYLQEIGVLEKFDKTFFSFEAKLLKPDEQFIAHVISELAVPANNIVYFDDSATCIAAAQKLHVNGLVYKDVPAIKPFITQLGLGKFYPE